MPFILPVKDYNDTVMTNYSAGEEQAWGILAGLSPEDVCRRAKVVFDRLSGLYILRSFHQDISISPQNEEISGNSPVGEFLLSELGYYSRLSILWYLIRAKDVPLSGELIKPYSMTGGQIYLKGAHMLPLDRIAEKYGSDIQGFLRRGKELGSEPLDYADASLQLFPFPRLPVTVLLWENDEEFPSRSDLLFDSTCEAQLPADITWSTAMMSVLIML